METEEREKGKWKDDNERADRRKLACVRLSCRDSRTVDDDDDDDDSRLRMTD